VRCNRVFIEQEDVINNKLKVNDEITLMDWGNVIITHISKSGDSVSSIKAKLHLEGDYKKTEHKLTWLPATPDKLVEVSLIEFGSLILEKSIPKEEKDWQKFINPNSKAETLAYGDPNLRRLKKGDQFQLERIGYFVLDSEPHFSPLQLILTPDGHEKNKFLSKKIEN